MSGIFVDTGAWFARFVPTDPDHHAAKAWLDRNAQPLITTDYVLDELLTLLKVRGEYQRALEIGPRILRSQVCEMERVTPFDVEEAWRVFSNYQDKGWSFTDCVSRVVMERLGLATAFAFDEHFRQFGTLRVVP
ncbi:MAG: PIN domain-containing protein [Paludisphaera borealis]|uniref:type II toxin-antitoxin system VapC family toxin n=1 Tax=Paludisphaera borealis TaxID=1387353 RepID=UPI00284FBF70|nr:PIN domain-containing protein [Paludisphaera borealis]MDR3620613.1 PIN domain-containing protein [Paludisphaera borealis]